MAGPLTEDQGPFLTARSFDALGDRVVKRLLTDRQRRVLISLSTRLDIAPRKTVFRAHGQASSVFICAEGALKTFRDLPSGRRRVASFIFPGDVFGLAEHGEYVNTARTLTRTTCYRIPYDALGAVLRQDAEMEFQFLCKVVHEVRELQMRMIMMGRRSAAGRVAMFIRMLRKKTGGQGAHGVLPVPMSRSDIADYLGLSLESVSRAGRQLQKSGVIALEGRHTLRILDPARLERLAADV